MTGLGFGRPRNCENLQVPCIQHDPRKQALNQGNNSHGGGERQKDIGQIKVRANCGSLIIMFRKKNLSLGGEANSW